MVKGLFSTLEFPYVQFPVASSTGDILHSLTLTLVWQCIEHLEIIGLKVIAVVWQKLMRVDLAAQVC